MKEIKEKNLNQKNEEEIQNNNKNIFIPGKNNYIIDSKTVLGKGSFGKIYLGTIKTTGEEVAIKLESARAEQPQLIYEKKIYDLLKGNIGFPKIYDFFFRIKI